MALPTRAQMATYLSPLSVIPGIGEEYADQAFIMRAIGNFRTYQPGQMRVNWTAGASAETLGTDAGLSHTTAPGIISETVTLDFSALVAAASVDVVSAQFGNGNALADSMQMAVGGLYRGWVSGICGSGAGTTHAMYGADTIVAETLPAELGMHYSGSTTPCFTTYSDASMLDTVDAMRVLLPSQGENICITDSTGFNKVKQAIRAEGGGINAFELGVADFGFNTLMYDGIFFFHSNQLSSTTQVTTERTFSSFYFFNNGPEGVNIAFPAGQPAFTVDGPIKSRTDAASQYNMYMFTQIIPKTPRSVAKLTSFTS